MLERYICFSDRLTRRFYRLCFDSSTQRVAGTFQDAGCEQCYPMESYPEDAVLTGLLMHMVEQLHPRVFSDPNHHGLRYAYPGCCGG